MKLLSKTSVLVLSFLLSTFAMAQSSKYKCMLQMANYKGLEAYVVVSLVDSKGKYEKTLYIMGADSNWYSSLEEWDKQMYQKKENLDGITGASVSAGQRNNITISIDESKMNKGYTLRFESVVEDKDYFITDAEIPLTTADITQKKEGTGYIRFVKLSKVNS